MYGISSPNLVLSQSMFANILEIKKKPLQYTGNIFYDCITVNWITGKGYYCTARIRINHKHVAFMFY